MSNKKGFTLTELLAVIVIISVIAIPVYNNLTKNNSKTLYDSYEKLIENATNLYMEGYSQSITENYSCFRINYESLVKEGLLKEEEITCEGSIVGNRVNEGFSYDYYLTCKDSKGKIVKQNNDIYNNNCIGINKKFTVNYELKYGNASGDSYDGSKKENWTDRSIYQSFSNNDAYYSGFKKYQISDNGGEWKDVSGSSITTNETINTYRCVRAVDNDNNISGEACYYLAIDNTEPECFVVGNDEWTNKTQVLTIGCVDEESGCDRSSNRFVEFTETTKTYNYENYVIKDNVGNTKTCNGGTLSVMLDTDAPTCNYSGGNSNWTRNYVEISVSCSDNESGCNPNKSKKSMIFSSTTRNYRLLYEISDNAGNAVLCDNTFPIMVDTTGPTCNYSGGNNSWTKSSVSVSIGCSDGESGCASGSVSQTYSSTRDNATLTTTLRDNVGNTTLCSKTFNVKIDTTAPSCSVSKSNLGTKNRVNTSVSYADANSGCNSVSGDTNLKSSKTYTVTDKDGNSNTCSVSVSGVAKYETRTCNTHFSCSSASCEKYCAKTVNERVFDAKCGVSDLACINHYGANGAGCDVSTDGISRNCYLLKPKCVSWDYYPCPALDCPCSSWGNWSGPFDNCAFVTNQRDCRAAIYYY